MKTTHAIKITRAVGIGGVMCVAGQIVEVSDSAAKELIRRGRGVLAAANDEEFRDDEGDDNDGGDGDNQVDLSKMNKAQLLEYAATAGIADVDDSNTKAQIIAAIEAATAAKAA